MTRESVSHISSVKSYLRNDALTRRASTSSYTALTFRDDALALLKVRAISTVPDEIPQTERRHPGHRLFRKGARLEYSDPVERDLDEVVLRLHGDRVSDRVRPRSHAQRLVHVGIANFRPRFSTKLRLADAVSVAAVVVAGATSPPDVLESFRQRDHGSADAEEVRRASREVASQILGHHWELAIEAERFRLDDV